MSTLALSLREPPRYPLDVSGLRPDVLGELSEREINALPIWYGSEHSSVGELFKLVGKPGGDTVLIKDTNEHVHGAGAQMQGGRLIVEGDIGDYLGRGLESGEILLEGSCGDFACAAMRGGRVDIRGSAGDFLGAALAGERVGMRGGLGLVRGSCGDRAGERQRRGLLLVAGDAGSYSACNMIAGTLAVLGRSGQGTGFGMLRGTLLLGNPPDSIPATFSEAEPCTLGFLSLLARSLSQLDGPFGRLAERGNRVKRSLGDRACGGRGEILVWGSPC